MPRREDLAGLWDRCATAASRGGRPERRAVLDRVQATMALVEGHAEDAWTRRRAAPRDLPALRSALDRRRRERPPVMRLLERLLGLDLKMRQYEVGRRFCDAVVRAAASRR